MQINSFLKVLKFSFIGALVFGANSSEAQSFQPYFDANLYANENSDVVAYFGNSPTALFDHFMNYGRHEGRRGSKFLDPIALASRPEINSFCGGSTEAWGGWYRLGDYNCLLTKAVVCIEKGYCPFGLYPQSLTNITIQAPNRFGQWLELGTRSYFGANPDVASFCKGFYYGNQNLSRVCAAKHYVEYGKAAGRIQN